MPQQIDVQMPEKTEFPPRTVLSAVAVDLALISYTGSDGELVTQLAVVGKSNVILLNHRQLGIGEIQTPAGNASGYIREGVLEKMGKK